VSFYFQQTYGKSKINFRSRIGEVQAYVRSSADVEVTLPPVAEAEWNQPLEWEKSVVHFDFIRAGVPHAVVKVPALTNRQALKEFAQIVKQQSRFLKEGVNVTYVRTLDTMKIESVTFERGVEDLTRACGTGAVAAAYSLVRGEDNREVEVQVPGGTLFVVWKNGQPHLRGPAKIVAEMRVIREE